MGIEPSTNHVLGKPFARERGELIWLDHGDERRYDTVLRILDGGAAIAESEARIRALAPQPDTDYPEPTGDHRPIPGRGARARSEAHPSELQSLMRISYAVLRLKQTTPNTILP